MTTPVPAHLPDFETLARLARDDPQAFEVLRRDMVDDFIDHAPESRQARLRGLQFRVDAVRQLSKSDLGAAVKIYEMMWLSFRQLADEWNRLRQPGSFEACPDGTPTREAKILPLPPRLHH